MKVLDLFSGIGGFSLGLERAGMETVAFCEIEEFPRKVLAKHWPDVPIFEDVRKLKGSDIGSADVICGGYPCQPFSSAGKRLGAEDDRHLWPEFNRLVAELRPTWVIGENVAGHISMGLDSVLSDLEGQGYACRTFVIPACSVGAFHRRDRTWTVAHAAGERCGKAGGDSKRSKERAAGSSSLANASSGRSCEQSGGQDEQSRGAKTVGASEDVGDTSISGRNERYPHASGRGERERETEKRLGLAIGGGWLPEPGVGRVANGVPDRSHRLKALGNAVVPQIPEMIGRAIMAAENEAA